MSEKYIFNKIQVPKIVVSSFELTDKNEELAFTKLQPSCSRHNDKTRGQGHLKKIMRTFSLPAIEAKVNDKGQNVYRRSFSLLSRESLKRDGVDRKQLRKGQRLWRKANSTLEFPLQQVRVREKRQYFRLDTEEKLWPSHISRRNRLFVYPFQKRLLAKFRIAAKLTIFCSRKFKQHCLRYL